MKDWLIGLLFIAGIVLAYFAIGWVISPFRKEKKDPVRRENEPLLAAAESPRMLEAVSPALNASERILPIRLSTGTEDKLLSLLKGKEPCLVFLSERPAGSFKSRYLAITVQAGETRLEGFYAVWNNAADTSAMQELLAEIKNL